MEQNDTVGNLTQESNDSSISTPSKKAKHGKDRIPQELNHQKLETTSKDTVLIDGHLFGT